MIVDGGRKPKRELCYSRWVNPNQMSLSEKDVMQVALFLDFSRSTNVKEVGITLGRDSMMGALSHPRIGIGF